MAKRVSIVFLSASILCFAGTLADDRIFFNAEDERRWNTPPELIPESVGKSKVAPADPQGRFLPFSASFSLSAGENNAHSLNVGANDGGVSLSQSASQADSFGSFGGKGPGLSASQSSSFSAGLTGISASDSNAFNLNHPIFGGTSQANSNSFSLGEATATSHGGANNGHATSGAQSNVGGVSSGATSGAGGGHSSAGGEASAFEYQGHRQGRPIWTNFGPNTEPNRNNGCAGYRHRGNFRSGNYFDPSRGCGGGNNVDAANRQPSTQISAASASSGASSTGNGFSFGQSVSQSNSGPNGPSASTSHKVQTSGNAQGFSQGSAAAVGQTNGQTDASFGSGTLVASSQGTGNSFGSAVSANRGQHSVGQVDSHTRGDGTVQGTANAGSVSFVRFPEESGQNIPREFVRSRPASRSEDQRRRKTNRNRHPVDTIITEITDSVADLFDI
ncbi:uncharacterized transmembrane protein DDB_G0289901-like [Neodiprion fabricii]|uniref:uncharacterized transmembrane protein DDB_G0289901-like n=1 Tax=Neodiprion fabricii TaxID=2872261 RepID=UPI001ED93011|nr:uncharacterized transmembrane protein DDB_G0289901-like [Neodiprion fabricii]